MTFKSDELTQRWVKPEREDIWARFLASPALILAVFVTVLLGSLPLLSRYHFDEGWYTNSAIEMVRTGEYLTPRYPDGTVRFRKPIATYWTLVASYAVLGIGLVSSRLPFLLAGAATLWVTYRMARAMTGDQATASLAAAILGSNIQFMESSTKATPDMLQCLFMTLCFWGAAEILFQQRRESRWYALLYLSAGFAVATKGMLPLVLLSFLWGMGRLRHAEGRGRVELLHWGWLAAGLLIPLTWLAVSTVLQGSVALSTLFDDQVGARLEGARAMILTNVLLYLLTPLRFFSPWLVLTFLAWWSERHMIREYIQRRRFLLWFVLGWLLLNVLIFSFGNLMRSRYLLPTYPLTAVLLADVLMFHLRHGTVTARLGRTVRWVMLGGVGVGIFIAGLGIRMDAGILAGGLLFAALTGALYDLAFHRHLIPVLVAFALTMMVAFGTFEQAIKPVFLMTPAEAITYRILKLDPFPSRIAVVDVRHSLSNLIRLLSGGMLVVAEFPYDGSREAVRQYPVILASARAKDVLEKSDSYLTEELPAAYGPPKVATIWEWAVTGRKPASAFAEKTEHYLLRRTGGTGR